MVPKDLPKSLDSLILIVLAFKLVFIFAAGWAWGTAKNGWRSERQIFSATDFSLAMIWVWLWSAFLMLISSIFFISNQGAEISGAVPEYLLRSSLFGTGELVPEIGFPIYCLVALAATAMAVSLVKLVFHHSTRVINSKTDIAFWLLAGSAVAAMQAVCFHVWFKGIA